MEHLDHPDHPGHLPDRSEASLRAALVAIEPGWADEPIELPAFLEVTNPLWFRAAARVAGHVVKYAWSAPAAANVRRQAQLLTALATFGVAVPGPVRGTDAPVLTIYPMVEGISLTWDLAGALSDDDLAAFARSFAATVAILHDVDPAALRDASGVDLPRPAPQASPERLRRELLPLLDGERSTRTRRWIDRAQRVLAATTAADDVVLHGDLHGHNQVLAPDARSVRALLDVEELSFGDFHYDLRYLPAQAPTLRFLQVVAGAYEEATGRTVDRERVLAWNLLTDIGDALWRTQDGVEVVGGPIRERVDQFGRRLGWAGLDWS